MPGTNSEIQRLGETKGGTTHCPASPAGPSPSVRFCALMEPLEGSKKTSREEAAESSKRDANPGGSSSLPRATYTARMAYQE